MLGQPIGESRNTHTFPGSTGEWLHQQTQHRLFRLEARSGLYHAQQGPGVFPLVPLSYCAGSRHAINSGKEGGRGCRSRRVQRRVA